MSKFSERSFGADASQGAAGSGNSGNTTVDWDAYNSHISDTVQDVTGCGEKSPVPIVGIISGIVDCGMREYEPVTEEYQKKDPTEKKANGFRQKMVERGKGVLSTLDDGTEMITYTPTKAREVLYFVDFPSITVDKGQFFGDSNPAPYRVMVGGEFKGVPSRPVKVTGYPKDNHWYCGDGSYHVKLAKASGINVKEGFRQDQLLELIGKPLSFNIEVYISDKGFLQEKVNTPNRLMAGISVPVYDEDLLFYVGFYDEDNDPQSLKFLKKSVKEYIKGASNYEGSSIEKQLLGLGDDVSQKPSVIGTTSSTEKVSPSKPSVSKEPSIDFDEEIPF